MKLEYRKEYIYNLIEESKIETECGGLYQAQDLNLQRTVAVKSILIEGNNPKEKQEILHKSLSEVRAMIRIGEENLGIPHIYDTYYDQKNNKLNIIMEWIKGKTIDNYMNVPELCFLQWMIDLCEILSIMEQKNIYHKDVKPSNIMINDKNRLYLIDFNISISTPNLVEGTINYKAPEMSSNSKYVGREKVDMFSIGVILYEFYTGSVPVKTVEYAKNRSRGPIEWDKYIEPIEKTNGLSIEVNDIIVRCMKLDPKQRYRNCSDLKNELVKVVKNIKWMKRNK